MQILLSDGPYASTNSGNGVEFDCQEAIPSMFQFMASEPTVLKGLSGHYETGAQIDDQWASKATLGIFFALYASLWLD